MALRNLREDSDGEKLLVRGWSEWQEFMKPKSAPRNDLWVPRESGVGWRLKYRDLCRLVPGDQCGIYEIRAEDYTQAIVVYVGSTCQCYDGRLVSRVYEYAKDGSHKSKFINAALEQDYSLSFRFRTTHDKPSAEEAENELLNLYDYAWNIRRNGHIRNIL